MPATHQTDSAPWPLVFPAAPAAWLLPFGAEPAAVALTVATTVEADFNAADFSPADFATT